MHLPHRLDRTVVIQATPATVFSFFTESERWASWWGAGSTVEPRTGGRVYIRHANGIESSGEVVDVEPPRRFVFTWGDDELRFALEPAGNGGCTLHFTHLLDEREKAARDAAGWHVILAGLARTLAGEAGAPDTGATPDWREQYEEYQRRGLPAGAEIPT